METDHDRVPDGIKVAVNDGPAAVYGGSAEESQPALKGEVLEHRFSLGAIVRGASNRIVSFSRELRSFASTRSAPSSRYEATNSAALNALMGLKFIRQTDGAAGWQEVEKCFSQLTVSTSGLLHRSSFAECIGRKYEYDSLSFPTSIHYAYHVYVK